MSFATYKLEIDWNNDGDFGDSGEDITEHLIDVECSRGRDKNSLLSGKSIPGKLVANVINSTGIFSSYNTSSINYGNIKPGRKIKLSTTAPTVSTMWTGYLKTIQPSGYLGHLQVCTIEAEGVLSKAMEINPSIELQENVNTAQVVKTLLDTYSIPTTLTSVSQNEYTIGVFYSEDENKKLLDILYEVEETEAGFLKETANGEIEFEGRHTRFQGEYIVSQVTFSDSTATTLSYMEIDQDDPHNEIYNNVAIDIDIYTTETTASVLWSLENETPSLNPLESKTYIAVANTDLNNFVYVDEWTTPTVSGTSATDIVVSVVANSDISVSVVKYTDKMDITLTNNNNRFTAILDQIQARGTAVIKSNTKVSVSDITSALEYGNRSFNVPAKWIQNTDEGTDFCNYIVNKYKDPITVLRISYIANRDDTFLEEALKRDISDRIKVIANNTIDLGINNEFYVESISHKITNAGTKHEVEYLLSDTVMTNFWILGVSKLGEDTRLCF
jgi:hypothetical protein